MKKLLSDEIAAAGLQQSNAALDDVDDDGNTEDEAGRGG